MFRSVAEFSGELQQKQDTAATSKAILSTSFPRTLSDAGTMLRAFGAVLVLLVWLVYPQPVVCQGTIGFGNKRSELTPVIEGDIEFVQCGFCKLASKHIHRSIVMMKAAMPSWVKKLPEEAIEAFLDRVCNSNQETGEWLTKLDVQQEGDALVIKQMPDVRFR